MIGAVATAIAVPLVMNAFLKRAPKHDEQSKQKKAELVREAEGLLGEVVESVRGGQPLEVGPGSAFHERFSKLREGLRYEFSSAARSHFDTSIGFELNRPGCVSMPLDVLTRRVADALEALRQHIDG